MVKGVEELNKELNKKNSKLVAMLAPSFIAEFNYPEIILQLRKLGFDKVVELTFGAKMVNREYHKILENNKSSKDVLISSVCAGIVEIINNQFPGLKKNLAKVNSPMVATAKVCKKVYSKHKTVFLSPCNFKKIEACRIKQIDFAITYAELKKILNKKSKKANSSHSPHFDKFYNDYTKIYPIAGGLSKTAHLKGVLHKKETKVIDGIYNVLPYLKKAEKGRLKGIRFLDVNYCVGGCIGGPCVSNKLSLSQKHKKVIKYLKYSQHEDIPESKKGLIEKAKGIDFTN